MLGFHEQLESVGCVMCLLDADVMQSSCIAARLHCCTAGDYQFRSRFLCASRCMKFKAHSEKIAQNAERGNRCACVKVAPLLNYFINLPELDCTVEGWRGTEGFFAMRDGPSFLPRLAAALLMSTSKTEGKLAEDASS